MNEQGDDNVLKQRPAPKKDFTAADMPHNRFGVFFDVLAQRFSTLFVLGLILLAAALPLIAVTIIRNLNVARAEAFADESEKALLIYSYINTCNFIAIFCYAFYAVLLAGAFGVIRKLVWQEGVIFKHDFFTSVKENGLSFALYAAVGALLYYLVQRSFRGLYFDSGTAQEIAAIASAAAFTLYMPTIGLSFTQSTVYNLGIFKKFSNSFLLSMRTFYLTLPVAAISFAPLALTLIPNFTVFVISLIALNVVFAPLASLANVLYADGVLDKFINKEHFPQIVDKGVWRNGVDKNEKTQ